MGDLQLTSGAYPGLEPPQHKRYELSTAYESAPGASSQLGVNATLQLGASTSGAGIADGVMRGCSPTSPLVPLW